MKKVPIIDIDVQHVIDTWNVDDTKKKVQRNVHKYKIKKFKAALYWRTLPMSYKSDFVNKYSIGRCYARHCYEDLPPTVQNQWFRYLIEEDIL